MPYQSGGDYRQRGRTQTQYSEADEVMSQIPLLGGWSGARGRIQGAEDAAAADANRAYWDEINAPSVEDLRGDPTLRQAQMDALDQMAEWSRGGLTGADRATMESARGRDSQQAQAQRMALEQQAQARGIGGSGLDFAMRQQADQGAQQRSSDRDAQMMAAAQQRALQATQQRAQLGSQTRQQDASDVTGAFDSATTRAAGATGQYSGDASTRQRGRDRQQESDDSLLGFLGSL